jgi:hypothetical protein
LVPLTAGTNLPMAPLILSSPGVSRTCECFLACLDLDSVKLFKITNTQM